MSLSSVSLHSTSPAFAARRFTTTHQRVNRLRSLVENITSDRLPNGFMLSEEGGLKTLTFEPSKRSRDVITSLTLKPPTSEGNLPGLDVLVVKKSKADPTDLKRHTLSTMSKRDGKPEFQVITRDEETGNTMPSPKAFLGEVWHALAAAVTRGKKGPEYFELLRNGEIRKQMVKRPSGTAS